MRKSSPNFQGDNSKKMYLQTTHLENITPGKLTWNLKITCLKRKIIFQTSTFGFHVNFQGCNHPTPHQKRPRIVVAWSLVELMGPRNKRLLAINTSTSVPCLFTWRHDEGDQGRVTRWLDTWGGFSAGRSS